MKHEPKPAPSLRARLTGALLLAVLAFAALQAAVTYRTARSASWPAMRPRASVCCATCTTWVAVRRA